MPDLRPEKGKAKWVVLVKFTSTNDKDFCESCYEAFSEWSERMEVDITPNSDGLFYAPIGALEVKCIHGKLPLLKSAYVS